MTIRGRVFLGRTEDFGGNRFLITKPGFDVFDETLGPEDVLFDSLLGRGMNIVGDTIVSIPAGGGTIATRAIVDVYVPVPLSLPLYQAQFMMRSTGVGGDYLWGKDLSGDAVWPNSATFYAAYEGADIWHQQILYIYKINVAVSPAQTGVGEFIANAVGFTVIAGVTYLHYEVFNYFVNTFDLRITILG